MWSGPSRRGALCAWSTGKARVALSASGAGAAGAVLPVDMARSGAPMRCDAMRCDARLVADCDSMLVLFDPARLPCPLSLFSFFFFDTGVREGAVECVVWCGVL